MTAIAKTPVHTILSGLERLPRPAQFKVLLRSASQKLRPPVPPRLMEPSLRRRQDELLASGAAEARQLSGIHCVQRSGPSPTIVLGGFVPDSTESVYLLKNQLAAAGSLYCINYPRTGFNMELLFAQLDDLVDELNLIHDRQPVIFSVSFGCGLVLEWLRRRRLLGGQHQIKGLVFVSPVACVEDLFPTGRSKATTLLGRAIQPYLNPESIDPKVVERSRTVFAKMFEAGAQNQEALSSLMTRPEVLRLRDQVLGTIRGIEFQGACERVQALKSMHSPLSYFRHNLLPLAEVPTLILYAEKEESVLDDAAPSLAAFQTSPLAYFPRSRTLLVRNPKGSAVQHASLIFHQPNFAPPIAAFYKALRPRWAWNQAA
jgi:pimeloyl-ACP methyl ester carboxylesterase